MSDPRSPIDLPRLRPRKVGGEDVVDICRTLVMRSEWALLQPLKQHVPGQRFLEWAIQDCDSGHDRGYSNAVVNAKRSVCCRIDELIYCNHLDRHLRDHYPVKLAALKELGISAPQILQDLIIDPRNQHEHDYAHVSERVARHAVELAQMFIQATSPSSFADGVYHHREILFAHSLDYCRSGIHFEIYSVPSSPLLYIDTTARNAVIMIFDYQIGEMCTAELASFRPDCAMQFAKWAKSVGQATFGSTADALIAFRRTMKIGTS